MSKRIFKRPENGYRKIVGKAWLWSLLAGPFYYLYHNVWNHALILVALSGPTFFIAWIVYACLSKKIISNSYLSRGWEEENVSDRIEHY
tara:strand:- start:150 stop:416 length:267 start_codon:yes stop_codon:yes gene_type:complete